MELVTVVTPTYNRANTLRALFNSLQGQSVKNFLWIIIDDGSNDNTYELVASFIKEADFRVEYYHKENGGKHTALNLAFEHLFTELTFIVDSDDVLTTDALEKIESAWSEIRENETVSGISFLRGYTETECIGDQFPQNDSIMNAIDIQFRYKVTGDKAEVWRTGILTKYRFPVFPGERFQGENWIWWQIAEQYDMLYKNEIIYITEYLDGGLSKSGRAMRIRCPLGGMENSKMAFGNKFPLYARLKYAVLYNCYADFAHIRLSDRIKKADRAKLIIVIASISGQLLAWYWKRKYL